jgi:hypothetical protein
MKKQSLKLFIATLVIGIATVSSAFAGPTLNVTIPFDFQIGNKTLKAGDYQIRKVDNNKLVLQHIASNKTRFVYTDVSVGVGRLVNVEKIVFNRYGDTYFLKEIYTHRGTAGRRLLESKAERKIRLNENRNPRLALKRTKPEKISISIN